MNAIMANSKMRAHPKRFALWVGQASIIMMFAALTSAYIVRRAAGNWLHFKLPTEFFISTGVILISSIVLHMSYKAFLDNKAGLHRTLLVLGFALGIAFVILQWQGWTHLHDQGVVLQHGNPSAGFLYLISGLHVAHVLGGIAALMIAMASSLRGRFQVTNKRKLRLQLIFSYWHFVDLLWVYLLLFFLYQQ